MLRIPSRQASLAGCLALLPFTSMLHASSDNYVDAVRADLDEFNGKTFSLSQDNAWTGMVGENDGTASLADFETFVKSKFRGTYILFARLPEWKKNEIWQQYVSTGDLGGIRSDIYAARKGRSSAKRRESLTNLPLDF